MTVTTATSSGGMITTHTGTLQEVIDALDSSGKLNNIKNVQIYYNGTNITAVMITPSS